MKLTREELSAILVREHTPRLLVLVRAWCARACVFDTTVADDLVQETFQAAWEHFDQYDPDRPFAGWLQGIARNKTVESLRRCSAERRHVHQLPPEAIDAISEACAGLIPDRGEGWDDCLAALRECLATALKPNDRDIVEQVYRDNRTCRSVADRIGVSAEAVKKRLQRSRVQLRDCIVGKLNVRPVHA